ncbi:HAMP domain-containing sensor histidine kinase [Nocardia sp. NPDC023852]|uniref:sensor histidine kinase n=1 Tax=Nocardia sp. NPDC023852 TaxID=3154697 RepID=UPI0033FFF6CF
MILLIFAGLAVFGFAVPLGAAVSTSRTQQLWFSRYVDAEWFAKLASHAMSTGDRQYLDAELQRYLRLYGERVLVVDAGGVVYANTGVDADDPAMVGILAEARSNRYSTRPPQRLLTWDPETMLIARPIGVGMDLRGAVLVEASARRAQQDIADRWSLIAVAAWTSLALCTGLALVLSRWILRPLGRLSRAVGALTETLPRSDVPTPPTSMTQPHGGPPEIRDLAESFDTMAQTVSDSVESQRQLVADTAHAIRNPLAALSIRLEALHAVIPAKAEKSFRRASSQVDRLAAILDGLLRLAVAETPDGFNPVHAEMDWPSRCDLGKILAEQVEAWEAAYERAGMSLSANTLPTSVVVAAPEDALVQILDVVLSNSCRYAGEGARTWVSGWAEPEWATISVFDNGVGVAEEEIDKLTTRFFRGRSALPGGSGLGLPIAAALAQRYRGRLTVTAASPHGLHVAIRLPMAR